MRFVLRALLAAENPRNKARKTVDKHHGGQFAAGQNVITDADFFVDQRVHALVHALVMSAQKHDAVEFGKFLCAFACKELSARRKHDPVRSFAAADRFHAVEDRLRHHHKSRSPAERIVGGLAVLVVGKRSDVVRFERKDAVLLRAAEDACEQVAYQAINLCACARALEALNGQLTGADFHRYMAELDRTRGELYDRYDARRLACAVELGLIEEGGVYVE